MAAASQSYLRTSVHVVGLTICIATYIWILPNITNPLHTGVGGSHQFLTIIGLTMTTTTFAIGLLEDIFPNKQLSTLGYLLSVTTTPLEVLIGTLYWTIYAINKNLLIPPGHGISLTSNLALHAVPAVTLVLDMLLRNTSWTIRAKSAMVLDSVFFFAYWAWLEYCHSYNGWFPYPLLMQLNLWQKLVHTVGAAGLMVGYTIGLRKLQERFVGTSRGKKD